MKRNFTMSAIASLCLFGMTEAPSRAELGQFSCYGFLDDCDSMPTDSSLFDILIIYKNIYEGQSGWQHFGWGQDCPIVDEVTGRDDYIIEGDFFTYAAQWDHSLSPRVDWNPASANIIVYY